MKVVLDVDGVMHPMLETACILAGIDSRKVDKYNINECEKLKDYEKKTLLEFFKDIDVFTYGWKKHSTREIKALKAIKKLADVYVNSISWTDEITEFKRNKFETEFSFLSKENIVLNTVMRDAVKAPIVCDIVIEDCYDNIKKTQEESAKYGVETTGILVSHVYNKDCTTMRMLSEGILVVNDFYEALTTAERVLIMKMHSCAGNDNASKNIFNAMK